METLDLEQYLIHVVPSEMSPKWEMETLKAQAIVSRTYARNCILHSRHGEKGHICNTSHCQNFNPENKHWKSSKAILKTQGQILTFNDVPIVAMYHASCGGETLSSGKVFKIKIDYLKGVKCPCIKAFPSVKKMGHRVGMCQWGAEAMARDGATYEEILLYYYQNVELIRND